MVEDTKENMNLINVRLTTACFLGFAGFLWFDKMAKLRSIDLAIDEEKSYKAKQDRPAKERK